MTRNTAITFLFGKNMYGIQFAATAMITAADADKKLLNKRNSVTQSLKHSKNESRITLMQTNWIKNQDCITGMAELPPNSVKMVFTDLSYVMTDCNWDKRLPHEKLWPLWYRTLVPGGVVVLTSIQPFTTTFIKSNPDFNYGQGVDIYADGKQRVRQRQVVNR